MKFYLAIKNDKIIKVALNGRWKHHLKGSHLKQERQILHVFLSPVNVIFEFSDMCVTFGIPIEVRKLLRKGTFKQVETEYTCIKG